jgi:hypothetical protein
LRFFLLSAFVSIYVTLFGQTTNVIPNSTSIAGTSVADTKSWTPFNNPSSLGYIQTSEIGTQYENRFLLHEISTKSIHGALKSDLANVAVSFSYFGYSLYHEMIVGGIIARNFSDHFSMGMQIDYLTTYFSASNSYKGVMLAQFGISVKLNSAFNLGVHAFNIMQSNIKTENLEKIVPSFLSIGTEYLFTPDFSWKTQLDREVHSTYRIATGFDYKILSSILLKLGAYHCEYLVPCIGMGFQISNVRVDFNSELHPMLGLNSMIAFKNNFELSNVTRSQAFNSCTRISSAIFFFVLS